MENGDVLYFFVFSIAQIILFTSGYREEAKLKLLIAPPCVVEPIDILDSFPLPSTFHGVNPMQNLSSLQRRFRLIIVPLQWPQISHGVGPFPRRKCFY